MKILYVRIVQRYSLHSKVNYSSFTLPEALKLPGGFTQPIVGKTKTEKLNLQYIYWVKTILETQGFQDGYG
jgi:hypothetical protein